MKSIRKQNVLTGGLLVLAIVGMVSLCVQHNRVSSKDNRVDNRVDDRTYTEEIGRATMGGDFYQIFYGDWEVSEFLPGTRIFPYDQDIIGSRVHLDGQGIYINDCLTVGNPEYSVTLVPASRWYSYCKPCAPDNPEKVFPLAAPYFAHVFCSHLDIPAKDQWANEFFVRDENTIIFNIGWEWRALYKAKRINSIEG